jgi:hypothetical protein
MKTRIEILILASVIGLLMIMLSGCYTQLGSLRNEKEGDEEYMATEQQSDSSYTSENESEGYTYNSGCCDDYYRPHVGFSYYYPSSYWPSVAFGMAYADPWFYDYAWGYNSWNNYYSPVWNPYYGYYPNSFYSPYYSGYYGYYNGYPGSSIVNGRRDVGEVRAEGRDNNNSGRAYQLQGMPDMNLSTGAALGKAPTSAPPPNRNSSAVKNNSRRSGNNRAYLPRDSRSAARSGNNATRASGRSSGSRNERYRGTQPQYRQNETPNSPPQTYSAPPRENRGSTPSYTPPPAPPPSSNNGSSRSGNDRSSGESRGRRP